jgi:hypothetical protein
MGLEFWLLLFQSFKLTVLPFKNCSIRQTTQKRGKAHIQPAIDLSPKGHEGSNLKKWHWKYTLKDRGVGFNNWRYKRKDIPG